MLISNVKKFIKRMIPNTVIDDVHQTIDILSSKFRNFRCKYIYKRLSKKHKNILCIKVGFLVQMPELWDKQSPLFDALINDDRFSPYIILVPEYDFINKKLGSYYDDLYFLEKYKDYCLKAYEDGDWIDVRCIELDYLFYQRPYDTYLPKELWSTNISHHTKCCYIPYAFWPLKYYLCGYNRSFFRSAYFCFLDSKENCNEIIKLGDYEADHRYIFCGYPSLDRSINCLSGQFNDVKTILWTPRWNYDPKIGGSHFFEYKDKFLTLNRIFDGINLLIRPHPLSFQNYVLMGKMTEEDVENYKQSVFESGASFDQNSIIDDTFECVDILVSDISSILYTYLLYEKPIILCNTDVPKSPSFESIMECMYLADNWNDILHWISEIRNGNDILKHKRHLVAERIKKENSGAVTNIIEHLISGK